MADRPDDTGDKLKRDVYLAYRHWSAELGKLAILCPWCERPIADAAAVLMPQRGHLNHEHFVVLCLDTRDRVVHTETVYRGSVDAACIRVAEVLRPAITRQCPCIVTSHNHPSGDSAPSPEDSCVVRQINDACKLLDLRR